MPKISLDKSSAIPIVTDREKGITKSLQKYFPEIQNVFCTNHILRDVEFWLKTCGTKEDIKVLKDDVTQLIDCETKAKFDEVYKILYQAHGHLHFWLTLKKCLQ